MKNKVAATVATLIIIGLALGLWKFPQVAGTILLVAIGCFGVVAVWVYLYHLVLLLLERG